MDKRPFAELISEVPDSPNFQSQAQRLSPKYAAWRNVPADGNCFYRSVAFALLDYLLSPATPIQDLEMLFKRIRWQEMPLPDDLITDYMAVSMVLMEIWKKKQAGNPNFEGFLMNLLGSNEYMFPFIKVLRNLSYQSLLFFKPEGIYYAGCEEDMRENLRFGQQSGEADLLGLSSALDINIVQVTMGASDYQETITQFSSQRREMKVRAMLHVGLISGHFYAFYPNSAPT